MPVYAIDTDGDGRDELHHRIEVKFSVVQKKAERTVTEQTVVRCIEEATAEKRMVAYSEWQQQQQFDCKIQQLKRTEFDVLYYGLFFFRLHQDFPNQEERHQREQPRRTDLLLGLPAQGQRGRGAVPHQPEHFAGYLDHYLYKTLTYDELYELLDADD